MVLADGLCSFCRQAAKALVIIEMVARVICLDIRAKFRSITREKSVSLAESDVSFKAALSC